MQAQTEGCLSSSTITWWRAGAYQAASVPAATLLPPPPPPATAATSGLQSTCSTTLRSLPSLPRRRTPELVVQHTHERTGWVALPPALCSRLFAAHAATPLALELRPIRRRAGVALPSDTPCYASWVGDTCAAGCVGVPASLARALGLQEGAAVAVRPLPDAPAAVSVTVEPASEDDWEIVQLNGGFIEETLLTQVRGREWRASNPQGRRDGCLAPGAWRGWSGECPLLPASNPPILTDPSTPPLPTPPRPAGGRGQPAPAAAHLDPQRGRGAAGHRHGA